jgi:hypothetical protein
MIPLLSLSLSQTSFCCRFSRFLRLSGCPAFRNGASFHGCHCYLNMINLPRLFLKLRTRVSSFHDLEDFSPAKSVWTAAASGTINHDRKSLGAPFRMRYILKSGVVFGQLLIFRNCGTLPWSSLQLLLQFKPSLFKRTLSRNFQLTVE